ncbi:MAG: hypothetical protein EOP56_09335 [Sphingobacteriales bacterium]|nr:MAG: hypothetical protein EOP56_09335 [Sphingobacteriales bacterium]
MIPEEVKQKIQELYKRHYAEVNDDDLTSLGEIIEAHYPLEINDKTQPELDELMRAVFDETAKYMVSWASNFHYDLVNNSPEIWNLLAKQWIDVNERLPERLEDVIGARSITVLFSDGIDWERGYAELWR